MDVSVHAFSGETIRLTIAGEIDMATVDALEQALTQALTRPGVTTLNVDFGGVNFCDSSGMAALDRAYATATNHHIAFELVNIQPAVQHVLQIVGLFEALTRHQPPRRRPLG